MAKQSPPRPLCANNETVSRAQSSRSSTLVPLAMNARRCTLISSPASTDHQKCFSVCLIRQRLTCGPLDALLSSFSSAYHFSLEAPSTTRSHALPKCLVCLPTGCWKWASNLASFTKRFTTSSGGGPTASSLWSNIRGSTARRSSLARNTSALQGCLISSGIIQCPGRE